MSERWTFDLHNMARLVYSHKHTAPYSGCFHFESVRMASMVRWTPLQDMVMAKVHSVLSTHSVWSPWYGLAVNFYATVAM